MNQMDIAELKTWLSYDQDTGHLTWLKPLRWRGRVAGTRNRGYIVIWVKGRQWRAHRLVWAMHFGEWPPEQIDHINGDKADNRIANLRLATNKQNQANQGPRRDNTSGMKGVSWCEARRKWKAEIVVQGRYIYLGRFNSRISAFAARLEAEKIHHGKFQWDPRR
jgi:hypothetical protein